MSMKEFKKWGKKDLWDFKQKVNYPTAFGMQTTDMCNFAHNVSDICTDHIAFVVAYDKIQEDWGFTECLGKHFVEVIVNLLAEPSDYEEDKQWKEDYKKWLKDQIKKLEG